MERRREEWRGGEGGRGGVKKRGVERRREGGERESSKRGEWTDVQCFYHVRVFDVCVCSVSVCV